MVFICRESMHLFLVQKLCDELRQQAIQEF
jgi:hypothetical protein